MMRLLHYILRRRCCCHKFVEEETVEDSQLLQGGSSFQKKEYRGGIGACLLGHFVRGRAAPPYIHLPSSVASESLPSVDRKGVSMVAMY